MFPLGHVGISATVAHFLRLNIIVVAFAAVLPDLVDKSVWYFAGFGNGRLVSHNLLFVFAIAAIWALFNRWYGVSALAGGLLHLGEDAAGPVAWFYPFKSYVFPSVPFDLAALYLAPDNLISDMVGLLLIGYLVYRYRKTFVTLARRWRFRG